MLKNSKIGCNWIFQILIGYYNWKFLISFVLSLVCFCFVFCFCWCCFFVVVSFFIFGARDNRRMFFFREFTCIYGQLGTLSIRVQNSLTVHDNSWALKIDNFSEFQNVISDSANHQRHYDAWERKPICDSPLKLPWYKTSQK